MRKEINIVVLALTVSALLLCVLLGADGPRPQIVLPARVVDVYDGDTVTVDVTLRMTVRLLDCWSPEVTGEEKPDGLKSKARLEKLAKGKDAVLTVPLHDSLAKSITFGRVLGRISVDGKDLSEQMVSSGAATKTKSDE